MSTFVLKKEYELQLPSSYVDIDREEMEYLDGGLSLYKWVVSGPVNMAFNGWLGGGTLSLVRSYISKNGTKFVVNQVANTLTKWLSARAANWFAGTVVGNLIKFSGWMSIGDVVANLWDRYDVNPNNDRLNLFW